MENLTKKDLIKKAQEDAKQFEDGGVDAIKEFIKNRRELEYLTAKLKAMTPFIVDIYEKENPTNETFKLDGVKVEKGTAGAKYEYKHCQQWAELDLTEKEVKAEKTQIQDAMKNALKNNFITATEDGEEIPKAKVLSYGTTTIKLTF
jgi:hypothetical protein